MNIAKDQQTNKNLKKHFYLRWEQKGKNVLWWHISATR
jgi:hypothetical protein